MIKVYLFQANKAQFAAAVFLTVEKAEQWISNYSLSRVLTEYPVDTSVYDWAVSNEYFTPRKNSHKSTSFIGGFTSASQKHWHYEDGLRIA